MNHRCVIVLIAILILPLSIIAQCPQVNRAFMTGEHIEYNLYFNWKFLWIKCGTAIYETKSEFYKGKSGIYNHLLFKTNPKFDKFFCLRDTLYCSMTEDLVPEHFFKASLEGKRHRIEDVRYDYSDKKSSVRIRYIDPEGKQKLTNISSQSGCIYDMISMMAVARSWSAENWKIGQRTSFKMTASDRVQNVTVVFKGRKNEKMDDGHTYKCLVFSILDWENKKSDKEILRFYFTDDDNHVPLRTDFFLKFGTAKAFLTRSYGLRNEQKSRIK